MRLIALFFMAIVAYSTSANAQGKTGLDYTEEYKVEKSLKDFLKADDKNGVARLISYPVALDYPLEAINNEAEFIANWEYFFDKDMIDTILREKGDPVGDKGLLLGGVIWITNGKVNAHNLRSAVFKNKLDAAREAEAANLYSGLHGYKNLTVNCDTTSKHVRIQEHDDGYHYFVWKKGSPLTDKPELSLKGDVEHQGTMGGEIYTFKNENYSYVFDAPRICEEECQDSVVVLKDEKEISRQVCK